MKGFLLGAVVGALTAVMVAPKRGEETREMVRARVDLWQDQVMAKVDEARSEVESMRREVLGRLDEMRGQFVRQREEMKIDTEGVASLESTREEPPATGI